MDGPKLKGLLGEEGWTFEDEEDIVEEAREKFEWCTKLKKDLRAMMGKKQIVAMREFLDVCPRPATLFGHTSRREERRSGEFWSQNMSEASSSDSMDNYKQVEI